MSLRNWRITCLATLALGLVAGLAVATPTPDDAVVIERVFNDCPGSTLTTSVNYPFEISIDEVGDNCFGWANLHVWRYAEGGVPAVFNNNSAFRICANLRIDGSGQSEAGLQIQPWWGIADGRLNCRTTDGEIACFGGRLPFYSFTAVHGITYQKGETINIQFLYLPNELNAAHPATITYTLIYNNGFYTSGPLQFDMGNPGEDPPYGLWGMLNDGRVGGFFQPLWALGGDPFATVSATFTDICFQNLDAVPNEDSSWGAVKTLFR
jgi:hypothetical protein